MSRSNPGQTVNAKGKKKEDVIQIDSDPDQVMNSNPASDEEMEFDEVQLDQQPNGNDDDEDDQNEEEEEMDQVEIQDEQGEEEEENEASLSMYQDIYADQEEAQPNLQDDSENEEDQNQEAKDDGPIYKDGKGQPRNPDGSSSKNIQIQISSKGKGQEKEKKKINPNTPTPRDRANRLAAHKLHVLSLLAHAKLRNQWADDENLKDELYSMSPTDFPRKLEKMKKSQTPELRERVRLFESLIQSLTAWWSHNFILDPNATSLGALRQPNTDILSGDLPIEGRRIDGWIVESGTEREARQKKERKRALKEEREREERRKEREERERRRKELDSKGKGKARAIDADLEEEEEGQSANASTSKRDLSSSRNLPLIRKRTEITLFGPGTNIRPVYLRLLPPPEPIAGPSDLIKAAKAFRGSRETSAQLLVAMCRALNIPARLVISLQVVPWSVGASKVATTSINTPQEKEMMKKSGKKKSKLPDKPKKIGSGKKAKEPESVKRKKPEDESTSDDEDFFTEEEEEAGEDQVEEKVRKKSKGKVSDQTSVKLPNSRKGKATLSGNAATARRQISDSKSRNGTSSRPVSVESNSTGDGDGEVEVRVNGSGSNSNDAFIIDSGTESAASNLSKTSKGKGKLRASDTAGAEPQTADGTPLKKYVYKPKLRRSKPKQLKATELAPDDFSEDVEPIDIQSPPTMWVEVYGRAIKSWYTIDPIRGFVPPLDGSRRMEPTPSDRQNKLVYVVGFEEDGTGRDITPRYTKTLHTRISRMRPPPDTKGGQDWWSSIVETMKRKPRPIERDAAEDLELENYTNKEAMPNSVAQFKDHPVFVLEKHLKREEVIFPKTLVSRFDGGPVYYRRNVIQVKSERSWYRIGRVVKEGETELKRVKARNAYTMRRKREQEAAKLEGKDQEEEEFLYAEFQTRLFVNPPIGDDGKIPTNSFGNIDLFVPTMLPPNGAHIPFKGVAKIAKKLGIEYAEAVTGFDFKAKVAAPVLSGIVVAAIYEDTVRDAYWETEQINAQKELTKKQERALKNWKKLLNAVRIIQRVNNQYGPEGSSASGKNASNAAGKNKALPEGVSRLRNLEEDVHRPSSSKGSAGGFVAEEEEDDEMTDEEVDRDAIEDALKDMREQHEEAQEGTVEAEEEEVEIQPEPVSRKVIQNPSSGSKRRSRSQAIQSGSANSEEEDLDEDIGPSPVPNKRPRRQIKVKVNGSSSASSTPSRTSTRPQRSVAAKSIPNNTNGSQDGNGNLSVRRSGRARGEKSRAQLEREEQQRLLDEEMLSG